MSEIWEGGREEGSSPLSRLALSYVSWSLALRADVLTESVVFAALAGHDRQKSLFDF